MTDAFKDIEKLETDLWEAADNLRVELIRSRGHLPKGGYDVRNGRLSEPTVASALHG